YDFRQFEGVVVHAVPCFRRFDLIADGPAGGIEPDAVFRHGADGLNNQGRIIHPFTYRIAVETLLALLVADLDATVDHFGKLAAISPNDAPAIIVLVKHNDLDLVLKDH